jgi:dTDP-glucose pyrophosphorylase
VDAGVACFDSVHPRWSFVKTDDDGKIVEVAEKRPLSRHAIAGFYFLKKENILQSAMDSIKKGEGLDGIFYIAPVLNELILNNLNLEIYEIADRNTTPCIHRRNRRV